MLFRSVDNFVRLGALQFLCKDLFEQLKPMVFVDRIARQTPPFRAGKESADTAGVLGIISIMRRLQAFKFELMPTGEQERDMRRFAGACRFVFNKALALQKANYEAGGKFIGYVAMAKCLTEWRNGIQTPWLKDAPVHPLQHVLKDLERAYKNFFRS